MEILKELGFVRKKCPKCGEYFRTLDPDRETCGDSLCEGGYSFIGHRTLGRTIHDAIRNRIDFFKRHGHGVVPPYPVVARRRDDIEFTIASIAVFQPRVVKGIVPPPENPLVIAQPSLRFGGDFNDLDNIGKTGRHLTCFVMGGQHSFHNIPEERKKYVVDGYRKDRAIELNFRFLTEVAKIPKELITYKEDRRSGGGNAGPSLEAFAGGLELVNAVFMQYEVTDKGLKELPMKVIDTGRGLERIARYTLGSPTIYEASFGPLVDRLVKELGVEYDVKLLSEFYSLAGRYDFSEMRVADVRPEIAKLMGYDSEELKRLIGPIQAVYTILDHVRTLVFALPDGGIPSNVGGGYNLRVILRRALSLSEKYDFDIDREELFRRMIDRMKISFPRVTEARPVIVDVFKVERERYKKALQTGLREVKKLAKKKKRLGFEELAMLYTSFGIPPETVAEIAKKLNVEVEIPPDFYKRIRIKHEKKKEEKEFELPQLPPTEKLYYKDRRIQAFDAEVLRSSDRYVVLDQTAFYPEGGGQKSDTGKLMTKDGSKEARVVYVFKVGDVVVHELDENPFVPGDKVYGIIDRERRLSLSRHHTAAHILLGAARRILGPHVRQHGAEKDVDKAHFDITHYKPLSEEEIREIERLVNRVIMENRRINKKRMLRTEAEKRYGVYIYQGGAVPGAILRIVEIEGRDVEACGGTHLDYTGEVGPFKIIRTKRIQDGVVRIEYVAGERAVEYIQNLEKILKEASSVLRVQPEELPKTVRRFFEERKEYKNKYERLLDKIAEELIEKQELELNDKELAMRVATLAAKKGRDVVIRLPDAIIIAGPNASKKYQELTGEEPKKRKRIYFISRKRGSKRFLFPIFSLRMNRILANIVGPIVVIIYIVLGIKIFDYLVAKGAISKNTSRKLIHIRASNRMFFRYFADLNHRSVRFRAVPPALFALGFIAKSRAPPDDPFVRSMTRTGDPKELLGGTFYFTIIATLLMILYILLPDLRLRIILANVALGRGDGVAALTGGYGKIGSRSVSGTLGFIIAAIIAGIFYLRFFGYPLTIKNIEYTIYAALVGALVELATPGGYDNITVPLGVLIFGRLLMFL